jgi:hypothetical protein
MLEVGSTCYYINQNNNDKITEGEITKETDKFFTISSGGFKEQRKKKSNVFKTEIELKATIIVKANYWLQEEYGISIPEAYKMFVDVVDEYPEKFV